jgi:apolipoprotein N-acyltransferase
MASLSMLVGIVLMVLILNRPAGKPLMSTWGKAGVGFAFALFAAWVVWLGMKAPNYAAELIGQAVGCVLIVGIFVAIGTTIRSRREKKRLKNLPPTTEGVPPSH